MNPDSSDISASIHLDYGADSADFNVGDLHICEQGLRLKTRWYFEPGAELSVHFQIGDTDRDCSCRLLKMEGVVVDCQRDAQDADFLVTVLFLEVTEDIREVIREVTVSVVLPG